MPIRFFCDKCKKEINQEDGFGKFDVLKKQFSFRDNQAVPTVKEEIYYLCNKCSEYAVEEIKNFQKVESKEEIPNK